MMTPDLIAFLNARLDEDKAEAASHAGPPSLRARQRREVAAKRAILSSHAVNSGPESLWRNTGVTVYWCQICDENANVGYIPRRREGCETLRVLAAVYSDHPDYREEWAPQ